MDPIRKARRAGWAAASAIAALLLAGCGGGGGGANNGGSISDPPKAPESRTVRADGGTVTFDEGGTSLTLPKEAVKQDTTLIVQANPIHPSAPVVFKDNTGKERLYAVVPGTVYEYGPGATTFEKDLKLTIKYDPAKLPERVDAASLQVYKLDKGAWVSVDPTNTKQVDTAARTVFVPLKITDDNKKMLLGIYGLLGEVTGGGAVTFPFAGGLVKLAVSDGAIPADTSITVEPFLNYPINPGLVPGTIFEIKPASLQTLKPVQLTIKYDASKIPAGVPEQSLKLYKVVGGAWQLVQGSAVSTDVDAKVVTGSISSFGAYGVLGNLSIDIQPETVHLTTAAGWGGGQTWAFSEGAGRDNKAVSWSVQEGAAGGTITAGGFYTAPGVRGTYHVIATSKIDPTKRDIATVVVEDVADIKEQDVPLPGGGSVRMVYVPAGRFQMGDNGNEGYSALNEFPQHSVSVKGYWIGKFELTRGQYRAFIDAGGYQNRAYWSAEGWAWKEAQSGIRPDILVDRQTWGTPPGAFTQTASHPVVGVTYYEAEAFCKWAGFRLPTEAEWEKAARWDWSKNGKDGRPNVYPWGDIWDSQVNSDRIEKCNNWEDYDYPGYQTAPVGRYPAGISPFGCHDMAGNAWEWCQDWYEETYYNQKPLGGWVNPLGPAQAAHRVLRGGSWVQGDIAFDMRSTSRDHLPPEISPTGLFEYRYDHSVGFRVVRDK
ncbi:MAG: formylglycine-generating enzyme family protein [Armatimonadetes bacterium]|nr:formylglycine-generating enzyme family protein [Armatimonadota bacterium]